MIIAHFVGAMLVFVLGVVYMWLHTFISYRIYHANLTRHHGSIIIVLRLLLSILCTFALLTSKNDSVIDSTQKEFAPSLSYDIVFSLCI